MSLLIKIVVYFVVALVIVGSICVTLAALFPPKEWKGDLPRKEQERLYRTHAYNN